MPSANDNFANRIALSPLSGGSETFDNTGNTTETNEPSARSNPRFRSAWYSITPTDLRIYRFRVTDGSHPSAQDILAFYGTTTMDIQMDNYWLGPMWSQVEGGVSDKRNRFFPALGWLASDLGEWREFQIPAREIPLQVFVTNSSHQGTVTFEWEEQTPPANNDWDDAEEITGATGSTSGTTEGATWNTALPGFSFPGYTEPGVGIEWQSCLRGVVWYKLTGATNPGTYRFTLTPDTGVTDLLLVAMNGNTYEDQTVLGWGQSGESIDIPVTQFGVDSIYVAVAALNLGLPDTNDYTRWRGTFDLDWEFVPGPANDAWEDAEVLVGGSGTATEDDLEGATIELNEPFLREEDDPTETDRGSVWFQYAPSTTGLYEFTTGAPLAAETVPRIDVFKGPAITDLERVEHIYAYPGAPTFTLGVGLRSGTTYWVRMSASTQSDRYMGEPGSDFGPFDWAFIGAAPANDDFADAETITGLSGSVSGDNSYATSEDGEPVYAYDLDVDTTYYMPTVWYEWTAPSTGYFRFWTDVADPDIDTDLAVFTGPAVDDLIQIVENSDGFDPATDFSSIIEFSATIGVTYYIRVFSSAASGAGPFDLNWATASAPANDDFLDAEILPSTESGGPTTFDNLGADTDLEDEEPDPNAETGDGAILFGRSVWFAWVPPFDGLYEFTINAPGLQGWWMIYECDGAPSFANLSFLNEGDVWYTDDSYQIQAEEDKTYYIRFVGFRDFLDGTLHTEKAYAITQGQFDISWVRIPVPPANDNLTNQVDNYNHLGNLSQYDDFWDASIGAKLVTNRDATAQVGELSVAGFGPERSVWFYYEAGYTGTVRMWLESADLTDMVMAVYEFGAYNASAPGTLVIADDDSGVGSMPEVEWTQTQFDGYFIQVDSKDDPGGDFTVRWVRPTVSPPANDAWADAIEIVGDTATVSGTVSDGTAEVGEPGQDGEGPFNSVWYRVSSPVDRGIAVTLKSVGDNNPDGIRAISYRGSSLTSLTDITDGDYPWVFDPDEEQTVTYDLLGGTDLYISVSGYYEQQGDFELSIALSSLTPPTGDDFTDAVDSGTGAGSTASDTEGATVEAGEPTTSGISGTVWFKFVPDYDGIYIFSAPRTGGGYYQYSVWQGTSMASLVPVPGWYLNFQTPQVNTSNPRTLRADTEYRIRVERLTGQEWGPFSLDVTAYPDYDDWESATAGYDTLSGTAGYDSMNDQVTCSGGEGYASVDPFIDLDDNPQNAGRRWIQIKFKMRVTEGVTMYREGFSNMLGVMRLKNPDGDVVFQVVLNGNLDGTNSLCLYKPENTFPVETFFAHFGTREREFNEWVDVEFSFPSPRSFDAVPQAYYCEVAINGVSKKIRISGSDYFTGAFLLDAPIRTVEFGSFVYPTDYQTTVAGVLGQEPHDTWEIQIKDVKIRNRPTLGSLPPSDVADMGITHFDGWEHGDMLDNIRFQPSWPVVSIVDAPGLPPGNADWWKAVRVNGPAVPGSTVVNGGPVYQGLGCPKMWAGYWVYFDSFPDLPDDTYMMSMSRFVAGAPSQNWQDDLDYAFGVLAVTNTGELRVIPYLNSRTWISECVAHLSEGTWYWIEIEVDTSVLWETTARVQINGVNMGTFGGARTLAEIQALSPPLDAVSYARYSAADFPSGFEVGVQQLFQTFQASTFWSFAPNKSLVDVYFAHVCFGHAVTWPQGALQTKLFDGVDSDGTHSFPELPVDHVHLREGSTEKMWTLYDYTDDNSAYMNPSPGAAPPNYFWNGTPGGGTIDVVSDGAGPAEIAALNAIRWQARTGLPTMDYGTRHIWNFGYASRDWYTTPEGGHASDQYTAVAWITGPGDILFVNYTQPGNGPEYWGVQGGLTGSYQQFWCATLPAWTLVVATSSSQLNGEWSGMSDAEYMKWKKPQLLRNSKVFPRFATSNDGGATWTMVEDPAVTDLNTWIGNDVVASSGTGLWMNNTSAIHPLLWIKNYIALPFVEVQMASVGYRAAEHYVEFNAPPSPTIEYAEEFGGTRGYNLHLRHGGYANAPGGADTAGDLYVTLWDGTHRAPMYVVSASAPDVSRVRYPTDPSGGHWTTSVFEDTTMRFGYHRSIANLSPVARVNSQGRGAYLIAAQWEVLSQAAPGPPAASCGVIRINSQLVRKV